MNKKKKLFYEECHRINSDGIEEKLCNRCEGWFLLNGVNFYKNLKSPDGYFPYCKECNKQKSYKWRSNNRERSRELQRNCCSSENGKIVREKCHKKWLANGGQLKWQQNNKDKIIKYNQKYSNKKHDISKEEWESCLDYFNHSCAYCGITEEDAIKKYKNKLHKEHVDHNGSNKIDNCVPACKSCNSSKLSHNMIEWFIFKSFFDENRLEKIFNWLEIIKFYQGGKNDSI